MSMFYFRFCGFSRVFGQSAVCIYDVKLYRNECIVARIFLVVQLEVLPIIRYVIRGSCGALAGRAVYQLHG